MAKKKSKRSATAGRGITTPDHYRHHPVVPPLASRPIDNGKNFRVPPLLNTDRRRFNPTKSITPPAGFRKTDARIIIKNTRQAINTVLHHKNRALLLFNSPVKYTRRQFNYSTLSERLSFNFPKRVEMCIRRGVRKRVMHAKHHAGKRGQKRPRRNFWSAISC